MSAGVDVPDGYCVTTEAYDLFLQQGFIDQNLIAQLEQVRELLGGAVAVRSSATCEDGAVVSMAGVFETVYLQNDTDSIADALQHIYQQSNSISVQNLLTLHEVDSSTVKMGVIVQRLVSADQSGVLYTSVGGSNVLVQYVRGFGDKLVDGNTEGSSLLIDQGGSIVLSKGFA